MATDSEILHRNIEPSSMKLGFGVPYFGSLLGFLQGIYKGFYKGTITGLWSTIL